VQLWWQQLFIFPRKSVIFCTKTSLISYGGFNSAPYEEFFSRGRRHHCRRPTEIGSAYAIWTMLSPLVRASLTLTLQSVLEETFISIYGTL